MFDSQKIDAFFEEKRSFDSYKSNDKIKQSAWRRAVKLGFPCVAAVLLGLMVIMPNIKKSVDLQSSITVPHKNEMEKLHMEETVFHSTDKKNRVNQVVADSVDELEPGSKILKIVNPEGLIPTDGGMLNITADEGYFNQETSVLTLKKNVKAVIDDNTTVTTEEATYDFNNETGFGDYAVKAVGNWGTMDAEAFTFDKSQDLLVLKGFNKIVNDKSTLSAEQETRIYQKENKTESFGNAQVRQEGGNLSADKIVCFFTAEGKKELLRAEAYGNVVVKTAEETAKGAEGQYVPEIGEIVLYGDARFAKRQNGFVEISNPDGVLKAKKVVAYISKKGKKELLRAVATGNVEIVSPKGSAYGDRGVYTPQNNLVELFDNVKIIRDGNYISGAHAETNLRTKISRIDGNEETGGRISGIFYKKGKNHGKKGR